MSDDLQLPADLTAIEAELARTALPPSPIDRDDLLFRAGWAACETARVAPRRRWFASHALVAAAAASVAVGATWFAGERGADDAAPALAKSARGTSPPAVVAARPAGGSLRSTPATLANFSESLLLAGWDDRDGPLVAAPWLFGRMVGMKESPRTTPVSSSINDSPPRATTARELMEEFLPQETHGSPS